MGGEIMNCISTKYPKQKYTIQVENLSDKEFRSNVLNDLQCIYTSDTLTETEEKAFLLVMEYLKK